MTPNQIQSDVLNQDNGRISPEGQLRRSCMRGMVPAGRSGTDSVPLLRGGTYRRAETRGKSDRKITLPIKLSPPISTFRTTTWRLFQHHAPLTPHIYERGWYRGDLLAQLYGVEAAVGSTHRGILLGYLYVLTSYETPLNER